MLKAAVRNTLLRHMQAARVRTDELFNLIRPEALYQRSILERHRIVFYLGHLEAFDWNLICAGVLGMKSIDKSFDRLFAFGIDPTHGNLPADNAEAWPAQSQIDGYNRKVREAIDASLN